MAFNSLLNNMELIKRVYLNATHGHRTYEVTKEEFLHSAQMMSQITPLEVDILFTLCDMIHHTNGSVSWNSLLHCYQYFVQFTELVHNTPALKYFKISLNRHTYILSFPSTAGVGRDLIQERRVLELRIIFCLKKFPIWSLLLYYFITISNHTDPLSSYF